jgi:hypothetical protein
MPTRRAFLASAAAGAAATLAPTTALRAGPRPTYEGPNVILVRFGGGVRRRETIDAGAEYAPFLKKYLAPRGVLFPRMEIASRPGVNTGHGEGTLNILTGKYDLYRDADHRFLGARFEAKVPTLFEAFRKSFDVPAHQALIINGEDRIDEEFYSFSNHHLFGVDYSSAVLSLYRFKVYLLHADLAAGRVVGAEQEAKRAELGRLERLDRRARDADASDPQIDAFWSRWAEYYGRSGFVNPRGDRLLAEMAVRAMRELRPRLMLVNFNDPDYVHWGNRAHYTLGVTIVDESLRRLHEVAEADEFYRGRTVFAVVPDCGRDSNPFSPVPYQHHFNSKSAHEIFAAFWGPGVDRGRVVDRPAEQCSLARTVAGVMGFRMDFAEGPALEEAIA